MPRRIILLVSFVALVALLAAGCGTRAQLATQMEKYKADLAEIRAQGAPVCSPREYASAEAHLDFAHQEWSERDYIKCQDHLGIVKDQLEQSRKWLGNCVEQVPPDKDGDGVMDVDDKCPEVPGLKEFAGCPDTDGDGIPDAEDKCPQVAGVKEFGGCPDTDGDGIPDDVDKCPKEWGLKENDGCPKFIEIKDNEIVLKQKIHFATAKATINPDSFPILDEIAGVMKGNKTWNIRVEGHTDNRGSKALNQKLSQARADSCRDYLVQRGIEANRLTAVGYAFDQPIASNNTEVGREMNRRTEFKITSK